MRHPWNQAKKPVTANLLSSDTLTQRHRGQWRGQGRLGLRPLRSLISPNVPDVDLGGRGRNSTLNDSRDYQITPRQHRIGNAPVPLGAAVSVLAGPVAGKGLFYTQDRPYSKRTLSLGLTKILACVLAVTGSVATR